MQPTSSSNDYVADQGGLVTDAAGGLLAAPSEESFERLTALAAKLLRVPVTFIYLLDERREFHRSCFGIPEPRSAEHWTEGRAFCHFALRSKVPLVVNDTLAHPDYHDVPAVVSPGVRAYLGIPLVVKSGQTVGSFCAIDSAPRVWTAQDVELLEALAQSTLREIELRAALRESQRLFNALEQSNQDLADFAHATSHDLKGPIRGIVGLADMIEEDAGEHLPPSSRRQLITLRDRAVRLHDLLDGVLRYSRAITAHPSEERVDTGAIIAAVVEMLAPRAGSSVVIRGDLPEVSANPTALYQIFLHLIGNALKHAGGAPVTVTISASPHDAGYEFFVADNGPGIPPRYHHRIWTMLTRLDPTQASHGIGLTLVKKLVERRGGHVGLTSDGPGATFSFTWTERAAA
jgi:signal transduction histidine kinase